VDGGKSMWNRNDIVYCQHPEGLSQHPDDAELLCAEGWHLCKKAEFVERNDELTGEQSFNAVIDDGDNCQVRHVASESTCWNAALDTRKGNCTTSECAGTCTGTPSTGACDLAAPTEESAWGRGPRYAGPNAGALCCYTIEE